jgi:3-dehydroquinate synthase
VHANREDRSVAAVSPGQAESAEALSGAEGKRVREVGNKSRSVKVKFVVDLGPNSYPVHIGQGLLADIGGLAAASGLTTGRGALITDANVGRSYSTPVLNSLEDHGFRPQMIEIAPGEPSKSLAMLEFIYHRLAEAELDRDSAIFALGGGVVGDLAGFAAATYSRGLPLVQVPTSMVAQVDSALGGKTGVNLRDAKNLIGAFYQPRLIVADVQTLTSLPEREFREGLAEVIKYGAIMDARFIEWLEQQMPMILAREADRLSEMVERSLRYKAAIVSRDEREGGLRKILNFGHTLGHALEASTAYGSYLHGEAVAIGMAAAARLSVRHAGLRADGAERLRRLLEAAGLASDLPAGWLTGEFIRALRLDKKRLGDTVEFVLLDRLGHALTRKLRFEEIVGET